MCPKANKRLRRKAAAQEMTRRYRIAEKQSPITRDQFDVLHDYLAEQLIAHGHDGTFAITLQWLLDHQYPIDETITFLESQSLHDDFELAITGDPHKLFGPTNERLARMPMPRHALESLLNWLEEQVPVQGCDQSTRLTKTWLQDHGYPVAIAEMALLAQGGGCDCEILLNVDPKQIYP